MAETILQTLYDDSKKRRVHILRRDDGIFTFEEQHFSDLPQEQAWIPLTWRRTLPLCDTADTALREAVSRIEWLADVKRDA